MENTMLSLEELAKITNKSITTIRRTIKKNNNIKKELINGKLFADKEGILQHFWLVENDYAMDKHGGNHMPSHWLSTKQSDALIDLSQQVVKLSTENAEMRKIMVEDYKKFQTSLSASQNQHQQALLACKAEQKTVIDNLKNDFFIKSVFARAMIYIELLVLIVLIGYVFLK